MQRRTQGVVALGTSAVLGVLAGVLVATTGPDRVVTDPNVTPFPSSSTSTPADNPAAVPGVPATSTPPSPDPTARRAATPAPSETEDNRGRGRGRGGENDNGSGDDSSGPGSDDG